MLHAVTPDMWEGSSNGNLPAPDSVAGYFSRIDMYWTPSSVFWLVYYTYRYEHNILCSYQGQGLQCGAGRGAPLQPLPLLDDPAYSVYHN